jgi:unsaturated rhamnogalacturonyl hydrolase
MGRKPTGTPELVRRVVRHAEEDLAPEREDWQKAVYLNGLARMKDHKLDSLLRRWVDRAVATQTTAGELAYGPMDRSFQVRQRDAALRPGWWSRLQDERFHSQTNTAALGYAVVACYEATGDRVYLDAAERQLRRLLEGNRTSDETLCQYAGAPYVFVDALYMMCPFLVRVGAALGDRQVQLEAARQLELHRNHLLDPARRLFRHVWCERPDHFPQSAFWSRGNGWVVAAAADVAAVSGVEPSVREAFVETARDLASVLFPLQDASGFWHNILDDHRSWLESSGTALFTYGYARGIADGWLSGEHDAAVRRARAVLSAAVDTRGAVIGVAGVPGGPDVLPEVNLAGQGAWLLAMSTERTTDAVRPPRDLDHAGEGQ